MTGPNELRRSLGFTDLMLITIGTVIGSGIYLVPSLVLRQTAGHTGLAFTVWAVAGFLSLLGALTYAELGAMKPEAGGLYAYLRDAFGPLPAFLYGWASFLVIASGSIAALAVAFANYLSPLLPFRVPGPIISLVVILVVALINIRGTRGSATVQNWTTGAKFGVLFLLSAVLTLRGTGGAGLPTAPIEVPNGSLAAGFGAAMIGVLWAYEGWQYVTFSAGEAKDPQRTFPRAISIATFLLIVLYLMANLGYVRALGPAGVANSQRVAADAIGTILGPVAGAVVSALILVSIFSALNGLILTTPRMYYAMARDGLFFQKLTSVHPRFGTPAFAIVTLTAWGALLAASGTFSQLLTYAVFTGWIFYALGALAVMMLRRSEPNAVRPFRVPGYPVTPILFVVAAIALVINTIVTQPGISSIGLAFVALGAPVFFIWRSRGRASGSAVASPAEGRDR
ncbi:MAG TPA: amino acid permease [Gemmatimonadaceae bacterium]|jgi:APA family basic amino acid/polyamine antiporter